MNLLSHLFMPKGGVSGGFSHLGSAFAAASALRYTVTFGNHKEKPSARFETELEGQTAFHADVQGTSMHSATNTTPHTTPCRAAEKHRVAKRLVMCVLAIPLGFFFMEFPWNTLLFSMACAHVAANLAILTVLFAIAYFIGQRTRSAVAAFLGLCLLAGIANHYVIAFKGQPVQPADLFALNTAFSVSGGYSFAPDARVVTCIMAFALACTSLRFVPKTNLNPRRVIANICCAIVLAGSFGTWFALSDIERDLDCEVGVWYVRESYEENGSLLCFLERLQKLSPAAPTGYSPQEAQDILAAYATKAADAIASGNDGGKAGQEATAENEFARPTVIAIMNETFSDLSRYAGLENTAEFLANYYSIAAESLAHGLAYPSTVSAGTCNSEFEFLTGSSMANLASGAYPYVLYDLNGVNSLVDYFAELGYSTSAIHPAEATNWRRDRVYEQLGFDAFYDITSFEDAETLRGFVTDRETYDFVLDLIEENDDPQFVFDVTIQNHGGYATGLLPEDMRVSSGMEAQPASEGYGSVEELDEFLGCMRQSDADLGYFIDQLRELDEPVVVCFFGDHQPSFTEWLYEASFGEPAANADIASVQSRYAVPYLIWANYETSESAANTGGKNDAPNENSADNESGGATNASASARTAENGETPTSLNFLGAQTARLAGLPLDNMREFLLDIAESVPAINTNGYLLPDGTWHPLPNATGAGDEMDENIGSEGAIGESTEASSKSRIAALLRSYEFVQYRNLFGKE